MYLFHEASSSLPQRLLTQDMHQPAVCGENGRDAARLRVPLFAHISHATRSAHPHEANAIFVPIYMESYGGFGDEALDWFRALKALADKNTYLASNTPDLLDELKDFVACIVQRHNVCFALCSATVSLLIIFFFFPLFFFFFFFFFLPLFFFFFFFLPLFFILLLFLLLLPPSLLQSL